MMVSRRQAAIKTQCQNGQMHPHMHARRRTAIAHARHCLAPWQVQVGLTR